MTILTGRQIGCFPWVAIRNRLQLKSHSIQGEERMGTPRILATLLACIIASHVADAYGANDAELSGVVRDADGAPVRGALIKANFGAQYVARFADARGMYRIADLPRASIKVTVSRSGFRSETKDVEAGKAATVDFRLTRQFDRLQLTSAEVLSHLPENPETQWIEAVCNDCHDLAEVERYRGLPEPAWRAIMDRMPMLGLSMKESDKDYGAKLAAKYFGPDAPTPTAQTVQREPLADGALNATFYGMDLPTPKSLPHSIAVDSQGFAWASADGANAIVKWNREAGTMEELPLKPALAGPHTPVIDREGKIWTALVLGRQLTIADPKTKQIDYIPLDVDAAHALSIDATGTIWGGGTKIYRVDPTTRKITYWPTMVAEEFSNNSWEYRTRTPGVGGNASIAGYAKGTTLFAYDAHADSKGFLWYTNLPVGWLVRLDPRTGDQTRITLPSIGSRGMVIDGEDNIWVTDWGGHGLVKYDQRTGKASKFKLPTKYAMPYSVSIDKKRGYLWLGDYTGNNLTRFDPRTEEFTEFPLPDQSSCLRFISVDDEGRVWFAEWWNSRLGMLDPGYSKGTEISSH